MKKLIAMMLMVTMVVCSMAGCGSAKQANASTVKQNDAKSETEPIEETVEETVEEEVTDTTDEAADASYDDIVESYKTQLPEQFEKCEETDVTYNDDNIK